MGGTILFQGGGEASDSLEFLIVEKLKGGGNKPLDSL